MKVPAPATDDPPDETTMIGDTMETDILGGVQMGYRTVLVLRHYENLKLTKIAEILEIPEGTVNSRMAEALSRLSRLLEPKLRSNPLPQERLRVMRKDSTSATGRPNQSTAH